MHYKATTPVLLRNTLRTTKYSIRSSATPVLQIFGLVPLGWDSVLQRTTPVLLCTTKYYSSTTPVLHSNTPVPPRFYSVLQSTTPVGWDSSTTLVPLQCYSVLQSTTPLLLRYYKVTLQYHSGTTPYYKVPLQYSPVRVRYYKALFGGTLYYNVPLQYYKVLLRYTVLQSTTPLLLCAWQSITPVLLLQYYPAQCCTGHRNCLSNITKQCPCHEKVTLQHDQILRLALLQYYYQPNAAPATRK